MTTLQRLTGQLAAVRVGTGREIHAGYRTSVNTRRKTALYTSACASGARRSYATGGTTRPTGQPVAERVTCRNCERKAPDAVRELNTAHAQTFRRAEVKLTEHLHAFVDGLASTIWGCYPAEEMRCIEVDALALVLLAGGQRNAAVKLIARHSSSDTGEDNAHTVPRHGDPQRAAEDYVRHLIALHASGRVIEEWYDDDPIDPTFTVYVWERDGGRRDGWTYVLHAPNPTAASKRAMEFHYADAVVGDDDKDADRYTCEVAPGTPTASTGDWNDYRLTTATVFRPMPKSARIAVAMSGSGS